MKQNEPPVLIVNFSTIHSLHSIYNTVGVIAELCNKYSSGCCSYAPGMFQSATNYLWVLKKYYQFDSTVINDDKLGRITTDEFLNYFVSEFPFVLHNVKRVADEKVTLLFEKKEELFSIRNKNNKEDLTGEDIARALLEEVWGSQPYFTEDDFSKFQTLLDVGGEIRIITNSNPIHVRKLIVQLKARFPNEIDYDADLTSKSLEIKLGKRVSITSSFNVGSYKTQQMCDKYRLENNPFLDSILDGFNGKRNVVVISHYEDDRSAAQHYLESKGRENWSCEINTWQEFINGHDSVKMKKI